MTLGILGDPSIGPGHLSEMTQQQVHAMWDTFDDVELQLTIDGFPPLPRPDFAPPAIDNNLYQAITNGDGKMLTFKNMQFSAWYSYALSSEARYTSRILECENKVKTIHTRLNRILAAKVAGAKKPTKDEIEREAQLDPHYLYLLVELQKLQQSMNVISAHVKHHATGKALTSRTVEVRRQDMESNMDGGRGYGRRNPEGM